MYSITSSFSTTSSFSNTRTDKQTDKQDTQVNKASQSVSPSYGQLVTFYEQNIRPVTPYLAEELAYLLDEYVDADLIIEALKVAVQRNASNALKFTEGVLRNWRNENITTHKQALNAKKKGERQRANDTKHHGSHPVDADGPFYTDDQGRVRMRKV